MTPSERGTHHAHKRKILFPSDAQQEQDAEPSRRCRLSFEFSKRPPPRPSPAKGKETVQLADRPNVFGENRATAKRQIFGSCVRAVVSAASTKSSEPSLTNGPHFNTSGQEESPSSVQGNEDLDRDEDGGKHAFKRRRGTPKRKRSPLSGKERAQSPIFQQQSSPAAKSLFAANPSAKAGKPAPESEEKNVATEDESWEAIRQMSPAQQRSQYWKLCYGQESEGTVTTTIGGSRSAQRARPRKGCLSSSNKRFSDQRPTLFPSPSMDESDVLPKGFATPKSSPTANKSTTRKQPATGSRSVQFGPTRAAEYHSADPSLTLTPMPAEQAASRFPTELKIPTELETTLLQETKDNTAELDRWEEEAEEDGSESSDSCFTLIQQSDDSSEDDTPLKTSRVQSRPSQNRRRSSAFFSPTTAGHGLLDSSEDEKSEISTDLEEQEQMTPPAASGGTSDTVIAGLPGLTLDSPSTEATASTVEQTTPSTVEQTMSEASTPSTVEQSMDIETPSTVERSSDTASLSRSKRVQEEQVMAVENDVREAWTSSVSNPLRQDDIAKMLEARPSLLWPVLGIGRTLLVSKNDEPIFHGRRLFGCKSLAPALHSTVGTLENDCQGGGPFLRIEHMLVEAMAKQDIAATEAMLASERQKVQALLRLTAKFPRKSPGKEKRAMLEQEVEDLQRRLDHVTRTKELRMGYRKLQKAIAQNRLNLITNDAIRVFVPVEVDFTPSRLVHITFDSQLFRGFAPGLTLQLTADDSTGLALGVHLVGAETPSSDPARGAPLKALLKDQTNALRSLKNEYVDCDDVFRNLLVFASRLEWSFASYSQ